MTHFRSTTSLTRSEFVRLVLSTAYSRPITLSLGFISVGAVSIKLVMFLVKDFVLTQTLTDQTGLQLASTALRLQSLNHGLAITLL